MGVVHRGELRVREGAARRLRGGCIAGRDWLVLLVYDRADGAQCLKEAFRFGLCWLSRQIKNRGSVGVICP